MALNISYVVLETNGFYKDTGPDTYNNIQTCS